MVDIEEDNGCDDGVDLPTQLLLTYNITTHSFHCSYCRK